jgi:hypothetical protein
LLGDLERSGAADATERDIQELRKGKALLQPNFPKHQNELLRPRVRPHDFFLLRLFSFTAFLLDKFIRYVLALLKETTIRNVSVEIESSHTLVTIHT